MAFLRVRGAIGEGDGGGSGIADCNNIKYSYHYFAISRYNDIYWNAFVSGAYKLSIHLARNNSLYNKIIAELKLEDIHE